MHGHLMLDDGSTSEPTRPAIEQALAGGKFFWLDLTSDEHDDVSILTDVFHFHPLAVEDAENFGQRPKLDEYDDFFFLVVHGVHADGKGTVEMHCFYAEGYLVTLRRAECPQIDAVREIAVRHRVEGQGSGIMLLYRVVDALVDTFFPVLSDFDDEIDQLEDQILERPTNEQLGRLFDMKRALVSLRKVVTPQRDLFASLVAGVNALPGMTPDAERYFRDLYDHLIRISDLVDSYRDLLSGAMDTHLSTVSNRLNQVMKQLTVIATIFLPLTFLTGFFGQNFSWLVFHITGFGVFLGAGIGLEVLAVFGLYWYFRKERWV